MDISSSSRSSNDPRPGAASTSTEKDITPTLPVRTIKAGSRQLCTGTAPHLQARPQLLGHRWWTLLIIILVGAALGLLGGLAAAWALL